VDPAHYAGWAGELQASETDARDMKALADSCGYATELYLTQDATREKVLERVQNAAAQLQTGDIFGSSEKCLPGVMKTKEPENQVTLVTQTIMFGEEVS
jgi:hypothetical protein